jgi:peptidoglycan/LPS O-acetylase OafA/YrhL
VPDVRAHLVTLDAVRGIAIWAVVTHHMLASWRTSVGALEVPVVGWDALSVLHVMPGVPLFYLLSGYLLGWTEGRRAERGAYSLRSYAMRRALRLLPAYYVAIVVVVLLWPIPTPFWDVVSHLFFAQGIVPDYARTMSPAMWSLTPEVIFYLLLPLLVLKLPGFRGRLVLFAVLFLAALPTRLIVWQQSAARENLGREGIEWMQFLSSFPTTLLYLFLAGMLMRMIVERLDARPVSPLRSRLSLVLFAVSVPYLLLGSDWVNGGGDSLAQGVAVLVLGDAALMAFFASCVLGAPVLSALLNWRPLAFVGLISYSMFVFHQTVLLFLTTEVLRAGWFGEWVTRSALGSWGAFLLYFVLGYAIIGVVSYLGYRFIESPFLRLKPK